MLQLVTEPVVIAVEPTSNQLVPLYLLTIAVLPAPPFLYTTNGKLFLSQATST